MSSSKPYDQGNDQWLLEQCRIYPGEMIGTCMTEGEMMRVLYLAAEGALYLSRDEVERLEKRIERCQTLARQHATRAAKTKN